jgi:hypothetical protein
VKFKITRHLPSSIAGIRDAELAANPGTMSFDDEAQTLVVWSTTLTNAKEIVMARSLAGLDLQVAISGHLKNCGFRVQEEEEWDHNNKLDFVVTKFPHYPKLMSVGVQITSRCKDLGKLGEFVAKNDSNGGNVTVASKALYLEIEGDVDINKGGADLVATVLYAFQFDAQFNNTKVWGATIRAEKDSIGYRFFDPCKNKAEAASYKPLPVAASVPITDIKGSVARLAKSMSTGNREIEGKLHTFFPEKGFGFISAQDGNNYFMHITDTKDHELVSNLNSLMKLPGKTSLQYQVVFENGGKTRNDTPCKVARNIRLLLKY